MRVLITLRDAPAKEAFIVCIAVSQSAEGAGTDAAWMPSAKVALHGRAALRVNKEGAKRAGLHAGEAANALLFVDEQGTGFGLADDGTLRTCFSAGGFFTLAAYDRLVRAAEGVELDPNPGERRPGCAVALLGTRQNAVQTTGAWVRIKKKAFFQCPRQSLYNVAELFATSINNRIGEWLEKFNSPFFNVGKAPFVVRFLV